MKINKNPYAAENSCPYDQGYGYYGVLCYKKPSSPFNIYNFDSNQGADAVNAVDLSYFQQNSLVHTTDFNGVQLAADSNYKINTSANSWITSMNPWFGQLTDSTPDLYYIGSYNGQCPSANYTNNGQGSCYFDPTVIGQGFLDWGAADWEGINCEQDGCDNVAPSIPFLTNFKSTPNIGCAPGSCPGQTPTPGPNPGPTIDTPCFPPVDSTTASISALTSGVFSGILYKKGSSVQQMVLPGIFSFISENLVRFISADLPDIIGNSDYATWSAPLLSGTLTALSASSIGNVQSDIKLFLLGAATNYLTTAAAIYMNPSYCTPPK
jgi:hypothetical protein